MYLIVLFLPFCYCYLLCNVELFWLYFTIKVAGVNPRPLALSFDIVFGNKTGPLFWDFH